MLYKDMNTGELFTRDEVGELFEQFQYEMETEYEDLDEYLDEKIRTGNLEEVPRYDVFWVGGEMDGETLFSTDDEMDAINKARELYDENEELFETKCDWGIAIMDNETKELLENW